MGVYGVMKNRLCSFSTKIPTEISRKFSVKFKKLLLKVIT